MSGWNGFCLLRNLYVSLVGAVFWSLVQMCFCTFHILEVIVWIYKGFNYTISFQIIHQFLFDVWSLSFIYMSLRSMCSIPSISVARVLCEKKYSVSWWWFYQISLIHFLSCCLISFVWYLSWQSTLLLPIHFHCYSWLCSCWWLHLFFPFPHFYTMDPLSSSKMFGARKQKL